MTQPTRIKIQADETTLHVWTKDVDAIYKRFTEAEDDGLKIEVDARRSWFTTKITARLMTAPNRTVSSIDAFRFKSLIRRIEYFGAAEAA